MLNVSVAFPWRMLMKGLQFLEEGERKEGRGPSGSWRNFRYFGSYRADYLTERLAGVPGPELLLCINHHLANFLRLKHDINRKPTGEGRGKK